MKIENELFNIDFDIELNCIYIRTIWINPKYRGQGHLKRLLDSIQEQYSKDIVLSSFFTLVSMYKHLGFEIDDPEPDDYYSMIRRYPHTGVSKSIHLKSVIYDECNRSVNCNNLN